MDAGYSHRCYCHGTGTVLERLRHLTHSYHASHQYREQHTHRHCTLHSHSGLSCRLYRITYHYQCHNQSFTCYHYQYYCYEL